MKYVREVTIKELNEIGHKALFRGIMDDKRQFTKDYGVMRKVISYKPLHYSIRFRLENEKQRFTKFQVTQSLISTMLKNGCGQTDFEITFLEENIK